MEGRTELIPNIVQESFIENYPIQTLTVGTVTAQTGNATCSFTIAPGDLDASYHYYPRERQTWFCGTPGDMYEVRIPVGGITDNLSGTITITVVALDTTATLTSTYIYAGAVLSPGAFATAVGSTGVAPSKVGYDHVYFYAQVFKEALGHDGMALAYQRWWNNGEGIYMYNHEVGIKELQLRAGMNAQFIVGEATTNTSASMKDVNTADSTATQVYTTEGIYTWGGERGYDNQYSTTAGFLVTDLDAIGEYYLSVGVNTEKILWAMGNGLYQTVENNCKEYVTGATGALNDLFTPTNGKDHDLNIGFKSIRKNGFDYTIYEDSTFNNPKLLKNLMYNSGFCIPLGEAKDGKTGNWVKNLSVGYVGNSTYSREMVVGNLGGMDGFFKQQFGLPILNSNDANQSHWLSHAMLRVFNAFEIVRLIPV
jgi:hypothetical protein